MSKVHKAYCISLNPDRPVLIHSDYAAEHFGLAVQHASGTRQSAGARVADGASAAGTAAGESRAAAEAMLAEARQKAQEIMKSAAKDASEMVAAAKKEADSIREESRREGYEAGLEQGRTEGKTEYEQACQEIAAALMALQAERNRLVEETEAEFVSLVLDTAEKVLKAELDRNDNAFVNMVKHALDEVRAPENLTLRIHPSRYPGIRALMENPPSGKEWMSSMTLIQDAEMEPTDCRIETGCGTMDAGISTQLEQIGKAFSRLLE